MEFLVSTNYRNTGKSAIWRLDTDNWGLELLREDQYYQAGQRLKDYIYFGMDIYQERIYCVGGSVLSILDLDGNLDERRDETFLKDAHDLKVIDDLVLCTNTGHDAIEFFSADLAHLKSIHVENLACFRSRDLAPKGAESPDSLHLNFISERDGTVFLTHSFTSVRDRFLTVKVAAKRMLSAMGLQTRRVHGIIRNWKYRQVLDAGGIFTLDGTRILRDIHGAHDGVFFGDKFYISSTHNLETLVYDKDFRLEQRIPFDVGMILRGLYPINEATLLLGATYVDPERSSSSIYSRVLKGRGSTRFDDFSSIKVVDIRSGEILETIPLESYQGVHPEIFKIIPLPQ